MKWLKEYIIPVMIMMCALLLVMEVAWVVYDLWPPYSWEILP